MKLRLAKASQLSWSWGLAWLSLAKARTFNPSKKYRKKKTATYGKKQKKE